MVIYGRMSLPTACRQEEVKKAYQLKLAGKLFS